MHASRAMMALAVLPLIIITRTALRRSIGANRPLNTAVPGMIITIMSGAMPLRIATLTEAAHIVIRIIVTNTSPSCSREEPDR